MSGRGTRAAELLPALLTGSVFDGQAQPVEGALVTLHTTSEGEVLAEGTTQADGRYALILPEPIPEPLLIHIDRPHFEEMDVELAAVAVDALQSGESVVLPDVMLQRKINLAFWVATAIFPGDAGAHRHRHAAQHPGCPAGGIASSFSSATWALRSKDLYIFDFESALSYVDWNVIFLIMGMMIVIAVVERTGIFQWLAFAGLPAFGRPAVAPAAHSDDRDRRRLRLPGQRDHHAA